MFPWGGFLFLVFLGLLVLFLSRKPKEGIEVVPRDQKVLRKYLHGEECRWSQGWRIYQFIMRLPVETRNDEKKLIQAVSEFTGQSPNFSKAAVSRLREILKKELKGNASF